MQKKEFQYPELMVLTFDVEDIVTISAAPGGSGGTGGGNAFGDQETGDY